MYRIILPNIKYTLLALCLSLLLPVLAQENNFLLWRITGNGLTKPSYLFGSIHLKDKRVFNFNDSLLSNISACDGFAMEVDPDSLVYSFFNRKADVDTSNWYKKNLKQEDYVQLSNKLEKEYGISLDKIKSKGLKYLRKLLSQEKSKSDDKATFLDAYLMNIAKRQGKSIYGLEAIKTQEDLIEKMFNKEQSLQLDKILRDSSHQKIENLIDIYTKADLKKIEHLYDYMSDEVEYEFLVKRNHVMTNSIDKLIKTQSIFTTVGAAHLPGKEGIIQLLRLKGYSVEPVKAKSTGKYKKFKYIPKVPVWVEREFPETGYKDSTPGAQVLYDKINKALDIYMYIDLGSGIYYCSYSITSPIDLDNTAFDRMIKSLESKGIYTINSKKRIEIEGCSAMDVEYKTLMNYQGKMRIIINKNVIYGLSVTYHKNNEYPEDITRFFNSFKLSKKTESKWQHKVYKDEAFEIDLPGTIRESKNSSYSEGKDPIIVHSLNSTDNTTGATYAFSFYDLREATYIPSDTAMLNAMASTVTDRLPSNMITFYEKKRSFIQGYPTQEIKVILSDHSALKMINYIRGQKVFSLMVAANTDLITNNKCDSVFKSFKFLNYSESTLSDWTTPDSCIKLKASIPFKLNRTDTIESEGTIIKMYTSMDASTSTCYYVKKGSLEKYYYATNDSTFYNERVNEELNKNDSVIYKKQINNYYEVVIRNKASHSDNRMRICYYGNNYYKINARIPQQDVWNKRNNEIFNSFTLIKGKEKSKELFSAKSKILINDLLSSDSSTYNRAKKYLRNYTFTKSDTALLEKGIEHSYSDDSLLWGSTKSELIDEYVKLKGEQALDFIEKEFGNPNNPESVKDHLLLNLTTIKTTRSYALLKKLSINHPEIASKYQRVFFNCDSLQLARNLFPEILMLIRDSVYNGGLLELTKQLLDSGILKYETIQIYQNAFIKLNKKQLTTPEWVDENLVTILSYANDSVFKNECMNMGLSQNTTARWLSVKYLLKKHETPSAEALNTVAKEKTTRLPLYEFLLQINRIELYPKKYLTQDYFSESNLYYTLSDLELYPTDVSFAKKINTTYLEKECTFYIYKIKYQYDNETKYEIGYTGPYYAENKELISYSDLCGTTNQEWGKLDLKTALEEYIKASTID